MIRFANKYDNDKIIDLLKDFMINTKNPMANNPMLWSKSYVEAILNNLYAGRGFVLVDDKVTGILVAFKAPAFWSDKIYQLQETMLHGYNKFVIARLIKEYIKIGKDMINKHEVNQVVMSSYPHVDLSKFNLKLLEHHWEIK
jgi:hypothetical protein